MSLKKYFTSAPGKIILSGEHSVCYGRKGLACAIDLKIYILAKENNKNKLVLRLNSPNKNKNFSIKYNLQKIKSLNLKKYLDKSNSIYKYTDKFLNRINKDLNLSEMETKRKYISVIFLYLYHSLLTNLNPYTFVVKTEIPLSSGLGSSASFSAALTSVLYSIEKKYFINDIIDNSNSYNLLPIEREHLNKYVYQCEKIIHGYPSGIDNSTIVYGGLILFKDKIIETIKDPNLTILIINSNVNKSSKDLIQKVKNMANEHPEITKNIYDACGLISEEIYKIINSDIINKKKENICDKVNGLFNINQCLLRSLSISHVKIEEIIKILNEYNLNGKLTGAGGGGCVITLIEDKNGLKYLERRLHEKGFESYVCKSSNIGTTIYKIIDNDTYEKLDKILEE